MTYLYMSRADGEWARHDFDGLLDEPDEDVWTYIGRVAPELWNALPADAGFVVGEDGPGFHPERFETFGRIDDLVEWAEGLI